MGNAELNIISKDFKNFALLENEVFQNTVRHYWHFAGVRLFKCTFENILSNNRSPSFFWSCVFDHCVFKGKVAKIKLNVMRDPMESDSYNENWKAAIADQYRNIDIALDISNSKFTTSIDLNTIPGDKIIINNTDQICVSIQSIKESVNAINWHDSAWKIGCGWAIQDSPFSHMVIFACGTGKNRAKDLMLIDEMKSSGLALPPFHSRESVNHE